MKKENADIKLNTKEFLTYLLARQNKIDDNGHIVDTLGNKIRYKIVCLFAGGEANMDNFCGQIIMKINALKHQ